LAPAVVPDLSISPATPDIGFVHRRCADADTYFLANTGPMTRTFGFTVRTSAESYEQWDPMSGRVLQAGEAREGIELTLYAYQATVIVFTNTDLSESDQIGCSDSDKSV